MKHGENVTKLITRFIAINAIPRGGGLSDGIEFILNPDKRKQVLEKAEKEALAAIHLVKTAPDNPYGNDDEKIAQAILLKIEETKANKREHPE